MTPTLISRCPCLPSCPAAAGPDPGTPPLLTHKILKHHMPPKLIITQSLSPQDEDDVTRYYAAGTLRCLVAKEVGARDLIQHRGVEALVAALEDSSEVGGLVVGQGGRGHANWGARGGGRWWRR